MKYYNILHLPYLRVITQKLLKGEACKSRADTEQAFYYYGKSPFRTELRLSDAEELIQRSNGKVSRKMFANRSSERETGNATATKPRQTAAISYRRGVS